ncbi:hypothetical protein COO60DRAFT_1126959 [Scenedesmus sp. NREL 46B-D3]|nr:hypothetical protein COO60DRAFT_1126959 [Scenedesmus sp. NREL 46B-D3]
MFWKLLPSAALVSNGQPLQLRQQDPMLKLGHAATSAAAAAVDTAAACRCAGVTGWSSILRTLLVHQEHWQCLGMLNFLQLAGTPTSEEWEEVQDEVEEESEDEGYEFGAGDADDDDEEEEQELQEEEVAAVLATAGQIEQPDPAAKSVDDFEPKEVVAAISEAPDLLQQVLKLLDQKIMAGKQKQLEQQLQEQLQAAAATAGGAKVEQEQTDKAAVATAALSAAEAEAAAAEAAADAAAATAALAEAEAEAATQQLAR